jgi:TRAP-type C4-dicarboxylate transport system substrate-binding protein
MNRKRALIVIMIALVFLFVVASQSVAKEMKLRCAVAMPPDDIISIKLMEAAERFNKRVGPEFRMEVFPGGALVPFPEVHDAIRTGAVEMGVTGLSMLSSAIPETAALELPYLFESAEANAALTPLIPEIFGPLLEKKYNMKLPGCYMVTSEEFLSKKMIKTLEDWKGVLAATSVIYATELIKGLGGAPVFIPFPDYPDALQKGVVDAVGSNPMFTLVSRMYELVPYYIVSYPVGLFHIIPFNLKVWQQLPDNVKEALSEEIGRASKELQTVMVNTEEENLQKLSKLGLKVYRVPKAERERWSARLQPFSQGKLRGFGEIGRRIAEGCRQANQKFPYRD